MGIKAADGIKIANQVTLKWGDHLGFSGWAQCRHNAFKGRRGGQKRMSEWYHVTRIQSAIADFLGRWTGPWAENASCPRQRNGFCPRIYGRNCSPVDTLNLTQWDPFQVDFSPPERWDDKCVLSLASKFMVTGFSNHRKHTHLPGE